MKVSFERKIKSLIAIIIIVIISIMLKIKTNEKMVSIIKQDAISSEIKIKLGCKVYENTKNGLNLIDTSGRKIRLDTKDVLPPNNINDIETIIKGNDIIVNFNKPEDNGNYYEYIVEKNQDRENISFYAKSEIKGYSYLVNNNEKDTDKIEENKTDNSPIIIKNADFNKNYYLHIKTIDNNDNCSENKTIKINLPSKGINIEYIDTNTGKAIASSEKILGMINDSYNIQNLEKKISGYTFDKIQGNPKGLLKKELINLKFLYI